MTTTPTPRAEIRRATRERGVMSDEGMAQAAEEVTTEFARHRSSREAIPTALALCHAAIYHLGKNKPLDALMRVAAVLEHTSDGGDDRGRA